MKREKKEKWLNISVQTVRQKVEVPKTPGYVPCIVKNAGEPKKLTMLRRIQPKPAAQQTEAASEETTEATIKIKSFIRKKVPSAAISSIAVDMKIFH